MEVDPIEQTADSVARSKVGSRLWFSLCPQAELEAPRLVVTSWLDDPSQDRLDSLVAQQGNPLGGRVLRGIATVSPNGTLQFGAAGLQADDLAALAEWAVRHSVDYDALTRLSGATFLRISPAGVLEDVILDPTLWFALPLADVVPGTPAAAGVLLDEVEAGVDVWYWLTDAGADGRPAIATVLADDDPDATQLRDLVLALRGKGREAQGVLRMTDSGTPVLTTSDDLKQVSGILAALLGAHPDALGILGKARLARTGAAKLVATGVAPEIADMTTTLATLENLANPGDKGWFVFTVGSAGARLTLSSERSVLSAVSRQAALSDDTRVVGEVRVSKHGWLLFVSRTDLEGFVTKLASWAFDEVDERPGLSRLKGARFVAMNADGEMVRREKDDAAWAMLD